MKKIVIIIISIVSTVGIAQNKKIKNANTEYANFAYMDAVKIYENVVKKGYGTQEIYQNLGNSYYFNGNYNAAAKWYQLLIENETFTIDYEYYYRYYQTLKSIGEFEKANQYLQKFSSLKPNDLRSISYLNNINYLEEIKKVSNRYEIENYDGNSVNSDFGTSFYKNGIVFASSRGSGQIDHWTNQPFYNLFYADDSSKHNVEYIKKLNSKLNESTAFFTKDGKTVYFTRNNFINGTVKRNENEDILLKIYSATIDEKGNWENIIELPFNSDNYSCAHPALSLDEKTLYFASNMPGTLGDVDLFKVLILGNNEFGIPENLGPHINTPGRESFPFISLNDELYFASDGHLGLGGMDVFGVKINGDKQYSKVYNLGTPINSNQDDFAYIINSETGIGYFSSNRTEGKGYDDIYKFVENKKLPYSCKFLIYGNVIDIDSKEIIPNGTIDLFNNDLQQESNVLVDSKGNFTFDVNCDTQFYIRATAENYDTNEVVINTPLYSEKTEITINLKKRFIPIVEQTDLAKLYGIEDIYFDFDSHKITKKAEEKLAVLLSILKQYPQIKIDIRSHTDSRGGADYNLTLANNRAQATMHYLIENGITRNRLTAKGYGENNLINQCYDGVFCTETEHRKNRRSEFIIVK